jgi:MFS family permease
MGEMTDKRQSANIRIPALIKRNTLLIGLSQWFNPVGMQMGYGLGPLMIVALSGSASLAGMSVGLFAVSRFLVAYAIGKVTDAYGRKPGILLGILLGTIGSVVIGLAMVAGSLVSLIAGLLVMGMGLNASQQLRVAAADMYPSSLRARALGFVATFSLFGLIFAPVLTATGDHYGVAWGIPALAVPWLVLPLFLLLSTGVVALIRPDPKRIGEELHVYYPGLTAAAATKAGNGATTASSHSMLLRRTDTRLAIAANTAAQANMSMIMVLTSLILSHQGHSLAAIGFSHAFHSAGMFAFTLPLGWAADRFGRDKVLYPGLLLTIIGAALVAFSTGFWMVTLGTFLVGLGWSGANVSATALISDKVDTKHRGRAIGLLDSFAAAAALTSAVITGPIIEWLSLGAAGVMAAIFAALPIILLVHSRLSTPASEEQ